MSTLTLKRYERPLTYDGIVAGLIAGVIVDAFLFATGTLTWPASYNFIASAVAGKAALASTAFVPLGILVHFSISAGWGALFGVSARRFPQSIAHPTIGGIIFGLVVTIGMQLLLAAAGMWHAPHSAGQLIVTLAAHTIFFGVPIAWYVSRAAHRSRALRTT